MSEPYTPDVEELVDAYVWVGMGSISDEYEVARTQEALRTIDRIKAEAWDEGVTEAYKRGVPRDDMHANNPYRQEATR